MRARWLWTALAVGLLLIGGGLLWMKRAGAPPEEVAELLGEAGEKLLREPLRPLQPGPRVLVFALDGVGDDELRLAIRGGGAPHIAALLGRETGERLYERAYAAPGVLSILPSTTVAAWSALFTGRPAAETGVPGNEWFAREEGRFYAPAPVTIEEVEHALEVYSDGLVGRVLKVPTLYELADVRSYVSLSQVHRGADLLTIPDPGVLGELVGAAARGLAGEDKVSQEAYQALDETAAASLVESLRQRGVPRLQVVYFPGVDLYTHVAEQPLGDERAYVRDVIDAAIGRILQEYRRQGAMQETYVLFVADHGHTPVLSDDRHALGTEGDDEPPELLRRAGFRTRPYVLDPPPEQQDFQAAVAYQGAMAYLYLADRSTCPAPGSRCDWRRPPRLEEDVLPVVRAFDAANRSGAGVPALRGTLDLIFARGDPQGPFRVWDGERLVEVGDYLRRHPRPELLRLEERLRGLAVGPWGQHAGDVLLLARSGQELPIEERFYFSGRYRSWHGSPSAQDGTIPLLLAHPARGGAALRTELQRAVGEAPSQLDVTPLIRALLAGGPRGGGAAR